MKYWSLALLLLCSTPLLADGKKLHDAACLQCHAALTNGEPAQMYTRLDRKVKNLKALHSQVKTCEVAADVNWSQSQHDAVVQYLSSQYYRF